MMTPKSTLRHKGNTSPIKDFINGSTFHRVLSKSLSQQQTKKIKRLVLCSGKIYFELQDYINNLKNEDIHILRIEQLYPFPYDALEEEITKFFDCEIVWCQEEPKNMGPWGFIRSRVQNLLSNIQYKQTLIPFIGRRAAASPATGVFDRHLANQKNILRLAIEADMKEINEEKNGVSLVKYKLPIE
jgi:2-oxoglutarate dehydrogenase E1 component